jgi:hypothetical protein
MAKQHDARTSQPHPNREQAALDVTASGHSKRDAEPRSRWLMFSDIALADATPEKRINIIEGPFTRISRTCGRR